MYSIRKNGTELDKSLYTIDEENKTFSSKEHDLVLDFTGQYGWSFKTADGCEFNTGYHCGFDTGSDCAFETGSDCTFETGSDCTFKTGFQCVFNTGYRCTFRTSHDCTFNAGSYCVFKTGSDCIFKTYYGCVFTTGNSCTLLCHGNKTYRHFLDKSRYVFTEDGLIEIADKNSAILNMKHENKSVRNLCKDILKGK